MPGIAWKNEKGEYEVPERNKEYNNISVEELAKNLSLNKEKYRVEVYELPTSTLCEYIKGEKIK